MVSTEVHPAFSALSADDAEKQLIEMESLCMNCYAHGQTRLLLTRIPYYKDVILSSFECDSCHFKNNDIQPAQRVEPYGILINVEMKTTQDLNRQFVKSSYGKIRIKELDFEQAPHGENGLLTTIEGFLDSTIENITKTIRQIEETIDEIRKNQTNNSIDDDNQKNVSEFEQQKTKLYQFIERVASLKTVAQPFHFEVDDPSGNSFIENPKAPHRDEQMTIKKYRRTAEQNSSLGITDDDQDSFEVSAGTTRTTTTTTTTTDENESETNNPESIKDEVLTFATNCPNCNAPCDTNMKVTSIPYFKEVIVMATSCDICGQKSNEVKSGTGVGTRGIRYTLVMNDPADLSRDILVSETSSFAIPDLDFELSESKSIGGRFTTVEGIFATLKEQLPAIIMPFSSGDSRDANSDQSHIALFLKDIDAVVAGEKFVTIVLDDPAGNCYLQNICAPEPDPQLTVEHYERSTEQNELLGLNDMNVDHYEQS